MIRGQKCCVFQTAPMAPIPLRQYAWQHMSVVMQSSIRKDMAPLVLRSTLVPAANIGSSLSWPIFVAGLIFSMRPLLMLGILLFGLAVIFQLVTLPVEFNASSRAIRILEGNGMLGESEITGAKKVLRAAAMTYVASLASSILQLLRLVILAGGNRRDD